MLSRKISILNNLNTFRNMHLDIMIQILVSHNYLVFFLVSEHCQIGFISENGVTEIKIIMLNDGDALEKHEIF